MKTLKLTRRRGTNFNFKTLYSSLFINISNFTFHLNQTVHSIPFHNEQKNNPKFRYQEKLYQILNVQKNFYIRILIYLFQLVE